MGLGDESAKRPAGPRALALAGAVALLGLAAPALVGLGLDTRTLHGISVWAKPLKFDASLAVHLLTLFLLLRLLAPEQLERTWVRRTVLAGVMGALVEALYISLQAARGRASHFNAQTPLESFLYYGVMGPGAVVIVASAFAVGWLVWRRAGPGVPAGLHQGAALGLMLGSVLTLLVAGVLSSGIVDGPGHWVHAERSDASGLPLVGWSTSGGDLRVAHFFATHLMQVLPLCGWLADQTDPARARVWVNVAAVLGVLMVALTFWQALAGRPFHAV